MTRPPAAFASPPDVVSALKDCRRAFWGVALCSGVVNMLMLAGPLYMLQIYDRVLSSRSIPTLVALSVFLVGAYAFQAVLDIIRTRVVVRAAALLDFRLGIDVHDAALRQAIHHQNPIEARLPVRDLDQIRAFLTGAGPIAIVDMPWMPLFLAICFLIHWWLGMVALAGGIILLVITVLTERTSRALARSVAQEASMRTTLLEAGRRNSETVAAMGMGKTLGARWSEINGRFVAATGRASDIVGGYGSVSKVVRLLLQSAILGVGAYLVVMQELTAGSMIAASIMMGRALAPIETAIANWRSFISARQSVRRLSDTLARTYVKPAVTELPPPTKQLDVELPAVVAPGGETIIVKDIRFRLVAGEALGIIGPSGAGKTSLVRNILGIWPPARGTVRLDGAALSQWNPERLGRSIGFVSQDVELFDGTISENIARMAINPDNAAVLEAARAAGAHDLILQFPSGYDTRIGEAGAILSAGQRQRIALARALYGNPFLLVLDEPNSNLDNDGEAALLRAIRHAKARRSIVILIAHRPLMLSACDKVLFVANGVQRAFGPRDEVLNKVLARPVSAAGGNLKVVGEAKAWTE